MRGGDDPRGVVRAKRGRSVWSMDGGRGVPCQRGATPRGLTASLHEKCDRDGLRRTRDEKTSRDRIASVATSAENIRRDRARQD